MITQQQVLEALAPYQVDEELLNSWEEELGLEIPVDRFGNKLYSPLHINLFKNIQKHMALGRSLVEIKRMVVLPSKEEERSKNNESTSEEPVPVGVGAARHEVQATSGIVASDRVHTDSAPGASAFLKKPTKEATNPLSQRLIKELQPLIQQKTVEEQPPSAMLESSQVKVRNIRPLKRFASLPQRLSAATVNAQPTPNAAMLLLIDRMMTEKDDLQQQVAEMEKLNSHLYQANSMFQKRIQELNQEIERLQKQIDSHKSFQLMDEKSQLQKQLIVAERQQAEADRRIKQLNGEITHLKECLANKADPRVFVGNWLEESVLTEVVFDNFGINIDSKRNRMFKITKPPERFTGQTAIIETQYDYQTNVLWKRTETMVLSIINHNRLEGELMVEYILDGTPVARARYKLKCHRNGVKTD